MVSQPGKELCSSVSTCSQECINVAGFKHTVGKCSFSEFSLWQNATIFPKCRTARSKKLSTPPLRTFFLSQNYFLRNQIPSAPPCAYQVFPLPRIEKNYHPPSPLLKEEVVVVGVQEFIRISKWVFLVLQTAIFLGSREVFQNTPDFEAEERKRNYPPLSNTGAVR